MCACGGVRVWVDACVCVCVCLNMCVHAWASGREKSERSCARVTVCFCEHVFVCLPVSLAALVCLPHTWLVSLCLSVFAYNLCPPVFYSITLSLPHKSVTALSCIFLFFSYSLFLFIFIYLFICFYLFFLFSTTFPPSFLYFF